MKRPTPESVKLATYIHEFLTGYAPVHLTTSEHTLKNYKTSLSLYLVFLQEECGITPSKLNIGCFSLESIEEWVKWIKEKRGCSAQTCNIRLGAIRTFMKYLGERNIAYLSAYEASCTIPSMKVPKRKVSGLSKAAV